MRWNAHIYQYNLGRRPGGYLILKYRTKLCFYSDIYYLLIARDSIFVEVFSNSAASWFSPAKLKLFWNARRPGDWAIIFENLHLNKYCSTSCQALQYFGVKGTISFTGYNETIRAEVSKDIDFELIAQFVDLLVRPWLNNDVFKGKNFGQLIQKSTL